MRRGAWVQKSGATNEAELIEIREPFHNIEQPQSWSINRRQLIQTRHFTITIPLTTNWLNYLIFADSTTCPLLKGA